MGLDFDRKLFPWVKQILTYDDCPHLYRPYGIRYIEYLANGTLAHSSVVDNTICVRNKDYLEIKGRPHQVIWHEYAHIMESRINMDRLGHGKYWMNNVRQLGREYLIPTWSVPYELVSIFKKDPEAFDTWLGRGFL